MKEPSMSSFLIRMDSKLHTELKREAQRQQLSVNEFCIRTFRQALTPSHHHPTAYSKLIEALAQEYAGDGLAGVVLFGSAARAELTSTSDIDLLIVIESQVERALYQRWDQSTQIQNAIREERHPVNPQFVRLPIDLDEVGSIWLETAIEGRILWDPDAKVHRCFTAIRKAMLEGLFERAVSHGHPYWIRKKVG